MEDKITQSVNHERIFLRQLQTFSARVIVQAFEEGIVADGKMDELYLLLEGLQAKQVYENKGVLYE